MDALNKMVLDKKDLFLDKIFIGTNPGEHWIWQGDTRADGYGYFEMNHDKGHTRIGAHRASYIIFKDPNLDPTDVILHACDTRMCINPEHLTAGPQSENMADMAEKGRAASGEDSGQSKLTEKQVAELRRRYANGDGEGLTELANEFGISKSTASYIVNFKTWNDKDDEDGRPNS